jgi:Tfp pilus assembly protein PilF
MLAQHQRALARAEMLRDAPARALGDVRSALQIDGDALTSYYVEAAIYARLDNYPRARGALLRAITLDPQAFASWLLLGDIAVRHRDLAAAARAYRRAAALDPRDPLIRGLAADPAAA